MNGDGFELAQQTVDIQNKDGSWTSQTHGKPFEEEPFYTLETDRNGHVTAVCIEREGQDSGEEMDWVWLPGGNKLQTIMGAFLGTECSGYRMLGRPVMKVLDQNAGTWDGTPIQDGQFALTVRLETEGYMVTDSFALLIPEEDAEECWYHFFLRLEKTE